MSVGGGGRARERRGEAEEESQAHREPDGKREETEAAEEETLTPLLPGRPMHLVQIEAQECPRRGNHSTHRQRLSSGSVDAAAEDREIPFHETGRRKRDGASPDDDVPRDARGDAHVRQNRDDAARHGLFDFDVSRKSRLTGTDPRMFRSIPGIDRLRPRGDRLGVERIQRTGARFHDSSPDNLSFNTALARKSLFLTVPRGICLTSAISSYESPPKCRSVMSSRNSCGRAEIARAIALPRSRLRSSP